MITTKLCPKCGQGFGDLGTTRGWQAEEAPGGIGYRRVHVVCPTKPAAQLAEQLELPLETPNPMFIPTVWLTEPMETAEVPPEPKPKRRRKSAGPSDPSDVV